MVVVEVVVVEEVVVADVVAAVVVVLVEVVVVVGWWQGMVLGVGGGGTSGIIEYYLCSRVTISIFDSDLSWGGTRLADSRRIIDQQTCRKTITHTTQYTEITGYNS